MNTGANWDLKRARHWHLFLPPARPSAAELELYDQAVITLRGRAALLGSTPELRLLAWRHGLELTAFERSRAVFDVLRPEPVPAASETLVEGDWLHTLGTERAFDMVMADGALNMLPRERHAELLEGIAGLVRPGGTVLLRVHLRRPPRYGSAVEVFGAYRRGELAGPVFSATRTQLDMLWLDPVTSSVRFEVVAEELAALHAAGKLGDEEFAAYHHLAPYNRIELHYTSRVELEAMAQTWFDLSCLGSGNDYADHSQHPIYVLRRP